MSRRGVWLLLLCCLLLGCKVAVRQPAETIATADARLEGTGVVFTLKGYDAGELPSLSVVGLDGQDWTDKLNKGEREGDTVTVKLPGERGLAKLAVENLEYRWTLPGGQSLSGTFQYRDARFPDVKWEVTSSERLLVYHVEPLDKRDVETWERLLEQATTWTGVTYDERFVIWVFPSIRMLNDWARYDNAAGFWRSDIRRLLIYDEADSMERQVIMFHEMIHGITPGEGAPTWFNEGSAQLFESRAERLMAGHEDAPRWMLMREFLYELHQIALQGELSTADYMGRQEPPRDPYTVGVSLFLFVKHHHGDAGVQRLFREGGDTNGYKVVLEDLFHKDLSSVWSDWNAYLRSDDLLKDWETP